MIAHIYVFNSFLHYSRNNYSIIHIDSHLFIFISALFSYLITDCLLFVTAFVDHIVDHIVDHVVDHIVELVVYCYFVEEVIQESTIDDTDSLFVLFVVPV